MLNPGDLRTFRVKNEWAYLSFGNGFRFEDGETVLLLRERTARNPWGHTADGWDILAGGKVLFVAAGALLEYSEPVQ